MPIDFKHQQHAHCESGVTANLLHYEGIYISEPLAFGIGSGLFFAHIPFLRVGGIPGTTYRIWPGAIFGKVAQRLGIQVASHKFSNSEKAAKKLDEVLASGKPVGMLGSVYYLPYLPEAFRFHFNAHNFVAYGKEGTKYLISDPILDKTAVIEPEDLQRSRFTKGTPEPKGGMYYIQSANSSPDYEGAIRKGIKQTCFYQLSPPLPWFGNKAIFLLARKLRRYPVALPPRKAALYLGNIIRMQEEIGTGGAGFRFLYAAFLQEAANILDNNELKNYSMQMTAIGDDWRNFAFTASRLMKMRDNVISYDEISDLLEGIGKKEKEFFRTLGRLKL